MFFQHANAARFVSYIGQVGSGWGTPANNEEFLKLIGVPGYGGSKGYNILNFAFWISTSTNGGAAANGAAYEWQNILNRITSTSLRQTLTGTTNPSANALRSAIKSLYNQAGIKIFISAFGANDHPMQNGKSASLIGSQLASYATTYQYDGVDVDWEEAINGYFGAGAGGEQWLCTLTNALRLSLSSDKEISHAPQAPYFMGSTLSQYPNGGYATVHGSCGSSIDFYNVQFYNQGSTAYNTYNSLFVNAIGWSKNSAVYEIMNGASPENVKVPASKIVVGKHTYGDGSSFVSGSNLKSIFNSALSAGQWDAGFMSWQFYKEIYPTSSTALIDDVINANWNTNGGASTVVSTPSPVTSSAVYPSSSSTTSNINIVNFGNSGRWYYAAQYPLQGVASGYAVTKFEIMKDSGSWFACTITSYAYKCSVDGVISTPLSVRLTEANGATITGYSVINSFTDGVVSDFGSNFGYSAGFEMEEDAADEDEDDDGMMIVKLIVMGLVIGCLIVGCIVFVIRKQMRKQYVSHRNVDDDVTLAQLAKNDGIKVMDQTELIGDEDGNVETIEIDVQIDVNDNDNDAMMETA